MAVEIERVESDRQLREFIRVPWRVYAQDPNWVPWLYFERLEFFNRDKNPFFRHAEADYFIARRDGQAVGVICALINGRHNEFHQENVAHFGVFEVLDDPEAAAALLAAACDWGREREASHILGPMNLSTNDECGTLIEGFDRPPVVLTTYNPRYYLEFFEQAGFSKAMDLLAWNNDLVERAKPGGLPDQLIRVVGKVKQRYGLNIRSINLKEWDHEVEHIKRIYNSAWERNWGFVPMTDAEIEHLASGLRPIIDPEIVFLVEKDGQAVGFALSVPDVNEVLHKLRPGPSLPASYIAAGRMILNRRKPKRIRVLALGVLPEFRNKGVDALMYFETAQRAVPRGYTWAEASWILETNDAMNRPIELLGSEVYKRYRIYQKAL
ncbi:MAG: GNAT family N-acetyltransferase [Candidatus Promineifilaceae bacterium]